MHEKYIRRCLELAEESRKIGENPFGSVITCNDKVVAESGGKMLSGDFTNHAEVVVMRRAREIISDLSECVLYSNCEPCPMCAFMIRELKIGTVVFSVRSPHLGGYSKWNILEDRGLERFKPLFSSPPKVISEVLEKEGKEIFRRAGWTMDL